MRVAVTRVAGDGSISRAMVDTDGRGDYGHWEQLVDRAGLDLPPPYQPEPGEAVYEIRVDGHVVQVAETDLVGPLRELADAVLEEDADII